MIDSNFILEKMPDVRYTISVDEKGLPVRVVDDKIVDYIIKQINPVCFSADGDIYYYEDGVYKPGGIVLIKQILNIKLKPIRTAYNDPVITIRQSNEIVEKIRFLTITKREEFDKDLNIINMANGLYNWRTQLFMPHTPEYKSLIQIPINYMKDAECKNIDKMLIVSAKKEDIQKLYEFIAYLLYRGYPIQKFLILFGPSNTGKSIFLNIMIKFIGENNKCSVSLQDISKDRPALMEFHGKLANICSELSKEMIQNTSIMKKLTSNSDPIRARDLYKSSVEYINFAKFVFTTNIVPTIEEDIEAFAKRVEIAIFDHVYTKDEYDKRFIDSLTSPEELSGLFNKVVKFLPDLIERNYFTNQLTTTEAAKLYNLCSDPLKMFARNYIYEDPDSPGIFKYKLFAAYEELCKKFKVTPLVFNDFNKAIQREAPYLKTFSKYNRDTEKRLTAWGNVSFTNYRG